MPADPNADPRAAANAQALARILAAEPVLAGITTAELNAHPGYSPSHA